MFIRKAWKSTSRGWKFWASQFNGSGCSSVDRIPTSYQGAKCIRRSSLVRVSQWVELQYSLGPGYASEPCKRQWQKGASRFFERAGGQVSSFSSSNDRFWRWEAGQGSSGRSFWNQGDRSVQQLSKQDLHENGFEIAGSTWIWFAVTGTYRNNSQINPYRRWFYSFVWMSDPTTISYLCIVSNGVSYEWHQAVSYRHTGGILAAARYCRWHDKFLESCGRKLCSTSS